MSAQLPCLSALAKVQQTIREMLQDRGYEPPTLAEIEVTDGCVIWLAVQKDSEAIPSDNDSAALSEDSEAIPSDNDSEGLLEDSESIPSDNDSDALSEDSEALSEDSEAISKNDKRRKRTLVFFCPEPKVRVKDLRGYVDCLEAQEVQHGIIVSQLDPTPFTVTAMKQLDSSKFSIECLLHKYLVCNPTKHSLYREHRALSCQETKELLKKHHATLEQLPVLFKDDRICQYFNFPVNTVVCITRNLGSEGPYNSYRVVKEKQQ